MEHNYIRKISNSEQKNKIEAIEPNFYLMQGKDSVMPKVVLKEGVKFSIEILNEVVKMLSTINTPEYDYEDEDEDFYEDYEEDEEEELADVAMGPVTIKMETNSTLVNEVFKSSELSDDFSSKSPGRKLLSFEEEGDDVEIEIDIFTKEIDELEKEHNAPENINEDENILDESNKEKNTHTEHETMDLKEPDEKVASDPISNEPCTDYNLSVLDQDVAGEAKEDDKNFNDNEDVEETEDEYGEADGNEEEEEDEDYMEEEDDEDDLDLLDDEQLSRILKLYPDTLKKISRLSELVDIVEDKLDTAPASSSLHTSGVQTLVVYIFAAEDLAEAVAEESEQSEESEALTALFSRLVALRNRYLSQVRAHCQAHTCAQAHTHAHTQAHTCAYAHTHAHTNCHAPSHKLLHI